jgi:hypothetical protein
MVARGVFCRRLQGSKSVEQLEMTDSEVEI